MRSTRALSLLLLTALPLACGGGDPGALTDEGFTALGRSNPEGALTKFEGALDGLAETDELYPRAKMGFIQALTAVDPDRARSEFLEFVESSPVEARDYRTVGNRVVNAGAYMQAIDILQAAEKKFPGDAVLDEMIANVQAAASEAGDTSALDKLRGLGYI